MSQFAEIRADFNRRVATSGWSRPEHVDGNWPVPIDRWLARFYKPAHFELAHQRRLANHFLVGADPEFVFMNSGGRVSAEHFEFKAGLAYGADNNGRLVEIRPKPSRWVLEVLTSTWSTLKWMSLLEPATLQYQWRAGAFYADDGLGGHIHFGRKRPSRQRESAALDTLCYYLFYAGVWDRAEGQQRIRHAQGGGNTGYGRLGDLREQTYGYEYRVFPSWLCSPWMAYYCMTLAKLVVCDPSLLPVLSVEMEMLNEQAFQRRLTALLAFYKGLDDDAQLAYEIWSRIGFPRWSVGDFKASWGILGGVAPPRVCVQVPPIQIAAQPDELASLASGLLVSRPPDLGSLVPSWRPSQLPSSYIPMINDTQTYHAPGLGEIAAHLCCWIGDNSFVLGNATGATTIPSYIHDRGDFAQRQKALFPERHRHISVHGQNKPPWTIALGPYDRDSRHRAEVIHWLTSGLFPIWRLDSVQPDSYSKWQAEQKPTRKKRETFKFSQDISPKGGGQLCVASPDLSGWATNPF